VYQYLDGELTMSRRARIRWHLRKCEKCSPAFDFEANLKQMIRTHSHDDPPPELFDRLRTLIREEDLGTPEV
jgi:mycothiol system anti-sigma-R factor